jgi:hypothetical protein
MTLQNELKVLSRYVLVAEMSDLHEMAVEFALAHESTELEIVVDEIEKRVIMMAGSEVRKELEKPIRDLQKIENSQEPEGKPPTIKRKNTAIPKRY